MYRLDQLKINAIGTIVFQNIFYRIRRRIFKDLQMKHTNFSLEGSWLILPTDKNPIDWNARTNNQNSHH